MKKKIWVFMGIGAVLLTAGCFPKELEQQIKRLETEAINARITEVPEEQERMYIDEVQGTLQDFNGSQVVLSTQEGSYYFDVTSAVLECREGMLSGTPVSVIYEGQLSGRDTSHVKVLKVADAVHKKEPAREHTAEGELEDFTCYSITLKEKDKKSVTYPIIGAMQYFQNGLKKGMKIYLTYVGEPIRGEGVLAKTMDATHVKVKCISDIQAEIPSRNDYMAGSSLKNQPQEKGYLSGTVSGLKDGMLQVVPDGSTDIVRLNLNSARVYFQGGFVPGTRFTARYEGELAKAEKGVTVTEICDNDPASLSDNELQTSIIGNIIGMTANTVTVEPEKGISFICDITNASANLSKELAVGMKVQVIFHPEKSKNSNIYPALQISDSI